ncbi:MAG: hypothetical protein GY913_31895 [Proteobacteria bacterium]|nr:hypothetical protein [Pseudomonadota bacterium]MCP4921523.1 hypothetical protein [Pseudomonadota bacterium]
MILEFLAAALSPAWFAPDGTALLPITLEAALQTVRLATAGITASILAGLPLGLAASTRLSGPWSVPARTLAAAMRSVHELVWAILFLAALGVSEMAAVIAIAIPYTGTLAKVYGELIDEAPRPTEDALIGQGAGTVQAFVLGTIAQVAPQLVAYTLYRFECALRSAAVLGFFGFPTLGLLVLQGADNLRWGEVWLHLYALFALVTAAELWSGAVRRRLVVR